MTSTQSDLHQRLSRRRDENLVLLSELVRATEAGEGAVQRLVAHRLAAAGCSVDHLEYSPASITLVEEFTTGSAQAIAPRVAVIGKLNCSGGGRSLICFAHPDSEPVPAATGWRHNPFAAECAEGRLYGWGVSDDLAGVAIMVAAIEALQAAGVRLAGDLIITSTPSKRHARGVAAVLQAGHRADGAIYWHPAESGRGMGEVKAFSSSQLDFRITVTGQGPDTTEPIQTAFAHRAVNAVDKAHVVLDALDRLAKARAARVHHPRLDAAIGQSTNIMIAGIHAGAPGLFSRVPESCVIEGAIAFPPGTPLADVMAETEAVLQTLQTEDPWFATRPPGIEWVSGIPGAEISDDHPLYGTVAAAITAETGKAPIVNVMHTTSDIRNPIVQAGIPCVGLGPLGGDLTQNGATDEWVDIEDYQRAVLIGAQTIIAWCGLAE